MKKIVFLLILTLASFSAMAQKNVTIDVDYKEASSRYLEPTQSVMTRPLIADLQVSPQRITYVEKEAFVDYVVNDEIISLVPNFKAIALCHAARANNADMIIGATIDIITTADKHLEISITGYPAVYANFRNATDADCEIVKKGQTIMVTTQTDVLDTPEEKVTIVKK